jgi:lipoprotein-anchoring transpeptidase ErfK/SrfK
MDPLPSSPIATGGTPVSAGPEAGSAGAAPDPGPTTTAPRRIGPVPIDRRSIGAAAAIVVLIAVFAWAGTGYSYRPFVPEPPRLSGKVPTGERELKQFAARLDRRSRELATRLAGAAPRGVYIVIDQTQNRLYLKRDDDTLLEARCSAGSGMVLKESTGKKREWVFDSPRGRFEVLSMVRNPVWAKPDWAFVEEGQPIPTNPADRLETGSLGEYALHFGNGYMIHGTLYERLLGRAVSHGCIRVGREDLRKVWASARIGTPIFIY